MEQIKAKCQNCKNEKAVPKTDDMPKNIESILCTFCLECKPDSSDFYEEGYLDKDGNMI